MEGSMAYRNDLNHKATELRLGLPGTDDETLFSSRNNKRASSEKMVDECKSSCMSNHVDDDQSEECAPPSKAQIVGWPPIRSYRKNSFSMKKSNEGERQGMYVKVSMDGAPYLRKIDLKICNGYQDLLKGLENLFKFNIGVYSEREGFKGLEYAPTYEDKDGDWMLVGDVPWDMFISSCKRLRIMKGSEARGLGYGV